MLVNTEGPTDARIMLVGEAPGKDEDASGRPFVGFAGKTLDQLLSQAGIARYQCLVTNVARERPPGNRIGYFYQDKKCSIPKPELQAWIDTLAREIQMYSPNIVIALGSTALFTLTGERRISDLRGYILPCSLVPGVKVLAVYHPQAVNQDWKLMFPTVLDLRKGLKHSKTKDFIEDNRILRPNVSFNEMIEYMNSLIINEQFDKISIDIETDPRHPGTHICEMGIGHSSEFAVSLLFYRDGMPLLSEQEELTFWSVFSKLVDCKKVIMQNATFDMGVIWHNHHILVKNLWMDTLIAAHICWPELPRDLGFLASVCLDVPPWKGSSKSSLYNPSDVANTFGIAEVLDKEIDRQGVRKSFDFEMSLVPISLCLQLQGVLVDKDKQKELIETWTEKLKGFRKQLHTILGREVNLNSSKQLQQLLYVDLKLPVQYKRRKSKDDHKTMTTDANALRTLSRLVPDNPIFNLILSIKKADVLLRFLDVKLSEDSRVHTSYNITGASSDDEEDTKKTKRSFGRWSSSGSIILPFGSGNLQNIPPEARKMYKTSPGYVRIQADYCQAEAVVVAWLIGDHKMKRMFNESFGLSPKEKKISYDIHRMTFHDMTGIPMDEITKEQRDVGKTIRHATNYSAGPMVVANRLGCKLSIAKQFIELYHRANPLLHAWHNMIQIELKSTRTLVNLFGRKHRFLDRWGDSLFRSAYSYIPQSTVGDLLNIALTRLYDKMPETPFNFNIVLQLHDAVYIDVEEQHIDEMVRLMRTCMLIPLTHNSETFFIDVDFKIGRAWLDEAATEVNKNWKGADGDDILRLGWGA